VAFGLTGNVLINEDPKGLLLMIAHVQEQARCLYKYAMRMRMVPSDSASTNKFNASAWLVWLALSSGLRKAGFCFGSSLLSIR
jgi:hypothetical protein